MDLKLDRIVPGVKGVKGVDTGITSANKINTAFQYLEGFVNEQYPGKMDTNGLNSLIEKLHFNAETATQLTSVGELRYSPQHNTFEFKTPFSTIQIGQEMQEVVKNDQGSVISNGKMVYISSVFGSNQLVKLASASIQGIEQKIFGMSSVDIELNGFGSIITEGVVSNFDTSTFSEGDQLYLGENGSIINVEPITPAAKIFVGIVLRSHIEFGSVYVKIRQMPRMQKLSDVFAPVLTDGDILIYNAANSRWQVFGLEAELASKVSLTGDQTISGVKTFTDSPVVPTPTELNQAVNKGYVDTKDTEINNSLRLYLNSLATFDIDENYDLIFTRPDNIIDEFSINESGELILTR